MPELPEVETIVRDVGPHLTGRTLRNPRLYHPDVLRDITPRRFLSGIRNRTVSDVRRRAKHIVIRLDSGHRMVIQPRMTGALLLFPSRPTPVERRYAVLVTRMSEGPWFVVRDVRRLGTIHLLDEPGWTSYTARIGPEPLDAQFTVARLARRLAGTRQAIKKALMDQRRVAGIGNIYANEALFRAGVDPSQPANTLSSPGVRRLHRAVRAVLRDALAARGTTVRDYRTGTGEPGGFQQRLDVYDRAGAPCPRCGTRLATTHAVDGRQTTFCWRCQADS